MNIITLDFETYYDTEHSLSHLSTVQYVHSDLFKVWGVGTVSYTHLTLPTSQYV